MSETDVTATDDCYDVPQYWDLSFSDDTVLEADFLVAAAEKYCDFPVKSFVEPGCGGGRLVVELARRGFDVTGWDLSSAAADFGNQKLRAESLNGRVVVGDMRSAKCPQPRDMAYCLVNTFRHLLTEADAVQHLQTVAGNLRPHALYVIGMHLLPPDADEEDSEAWTVTANGTTVDMQLDVTSCHREARLETLRFRMTVTKESHPEALPEVFESEYKMRIYEARDMLDLIARVPQFDLLDDVYDFWYDIDDPLTLSDRMGDTVFILRRRDV